jgi:hypothetical protein
MNRARTLRNRCKIAGLAMALAGALCACGNITLGQGTQNDGIPEGNIIAQGIFTGVNGRAVTGTAAVYQSTVSGGCSFVVRLGNLSAPSDSGLVVIPVVNGSQVSPSYWTLRAPTGNQNYSFTTVSGNCGATFAQIEIANPALSPASAQNYGVATLTAP